MVWTFVVERDGRRGSDNMAIDHALLRAAGDGAAFLRLYRWAPACLSFGRNEPATHRYDRDAIQRLGLDTVRRPTGGRAVWHDAEVTYAVAAPLGMFGSLRESYITIHTMLADALRGLGAPVSLAERPRGRAPSPGAGACFAEPVGGELMAHGRKLVGSAQVRERGALLQHGSILLEDGQDVVERVTRGAAPPPAATSLRAILGRTVSFEDVAAAVAAAARKTWPGAWTTAAPPDPGDGPYAAPDWTWRA